MVDPGVQKKSELDEIELNEISLNSDSKTDNIDIDKPNINKSSKLRCKRCNHYRESYNVVHCSTCNVCIKEYDHHCGVLGVCIGKNNIYWF